MRKIVKRFIHRNNFRKKKLKNWNKNYWKMKKKNNKLWKFVIKFTKIATNQNRIDKIYWRKMNFLKKNS